jgi:LssY-like putative type I secretion system component LssY
MDATDSLLSTKRVFARDIFFAWLFLCWIACEGIAVTHAQQTISTPVQGVQTIPLDQPTAARLEARKKSYTVKVTGSDWVDTGLVVAPGDSIAVTATGTVTLSDGREVTADGSARGWKDLLRQFPDNSSPVGALVARIGSNAATVPFDVGASKVLQITSAGELYLRFNVSSDLTVTGSYAAAMKLSRPPAQAKTQAATEAGMAAEISPALFAAIPRRVQDQQGNLGDMVNFAMVGSEEQVAQAFQGAGWVKVDSTKQDAVVHGLIETLQHKAYLEMPMSTLYLFGRPQDLSYARADPIMVAAERHHLRIWKSPETVNGRLLWVGSSTHDIGFEKDQRDNGVTHKIDPEIDKEREFLEQSFAAAGNLQAAAYVTPSDPLTTAKTATGGTFQSDGRIVVLLLK